MAFPHTSYLTSETSGLAFRLQPFAIISDGVHTEKNECLLSSVFSNKISKFIVPTFSFKIFFLQANGAGQTYMEKPLLNQLKAVQRQEITAMKPN